jgi:hypothetical protein
VDGAYGVLSSGPLGSELHSLSHVRTRLVGPEGHAELRRLCHALPDDDEPGPVFRALRDAGFADGGLHPVDAVVEERLAAIGAPFAWHLDHARNGPRLATELRRVHARRKLSSLAFGQASCMPESGVARCLALTRAVGPRRRVLLVGDDDFLSVVLARLGHRVTVVEVDPLLVAFLRGVTAELSLDVEVREQDVLQPFPADLVGQFDAVMTDPMTHEPCLLAFVTRAVQALRPDGTLGCCVHPLGRALFEDVVGRMPLHLARCLAELSAYYYEGYVDNPYRSDLYLLTRTAGEPPWGPGETLPFDDIITGAFKRRMHGHTDIQAPPWRKPNSSAIRDAVLSYVEHARVPVTSRHDVETEAAAHLYLALGGGGHIALAWDKQRGVLSYDVYPFTLRAEAGLAAAFLRVIPAGKSYTFSREAPDLRAPTVNTPGAVAPPRSIPRRR